MIRVGMCLLVIPLLVMMLPYMMEVSDVNACIEQNQNYDYHNGICTSDEVPFSSYNSRYPWIVNGGMLLSVIGLLITMVGLYRPSNKMGRSG